MRVKILKLFLTFIFISFYISGFSQDTFRKALTRASVIDSLKRSGVILGNTPKKPEILLSTDQALKYLQQRLHPQLWNNSNDPLRQAFSRLVYEASHSKFDSLKTALMEYPYDSLSISWDKFYVWEALKIKIPVISSPETNIFPDSTSAIRSVENLGSIDSLNPRPLSVNKATGFNRPVVELKDTTIMVIVDTLDQVTPSRSSFPFKYYSNPYQGDSIQAAVKSLLNLIDNRDSSLVTITGIGKVATPMMLNSKTGRVMRFWLKNEFSDSVAVWLANPYKNTIGLYLEQGINFRRPGRQGNYASPKIDMPSIDNKKLQDLRNAIVKQPFWKYRTEASFVLNQASLSNWVKGGESSISTALDATEYADYNNKQLKLSSYNFARLKFGYIETGKDGIRKNLDLLETNSKINHKAFGKFDFSFILLFKTQIAIGRNYFKTTAGKDTSNLVSKFMNPAILTIGLGLDYRPNKTTSINFSPLSYKGTFVTDTANIDQTQYGIAKNRKSLNEPGVSFMITNEFKPVKTVTIVNRLQLFTNYIHNPQNVDVDWEMIATTKLNWFTDVMFNTHLIFDDDTKTDEQYSNGQPVLKPDGTKKKTARIQFKEMLGFALAFRF
jgi:Protein of unknown function (DUF3078).